MLGVVERAAHGGDVAGDAGGGLVVGKEHRLDLMTLVGRERLLVPLDRGALSPLGVEHVHLESEALRHVDPEMAEHAEPGGEHLVSGESVFDRDASQAPVPLEGKMNA